MIHPLSSSNLNYKELLFIHNRSYTEPYFYNLKFFFFPRLGEGYGLWETRAWRFLIIAPGHKKSAASR